MKNTNQTYVLSHHENHRSIRTRELWASELTSERCGLSGPTSKTPLHHIAPPKPNWLVVLTILKNMSSSMGRIIPYIYIYYGK